MQYQKLNRRDFLKSIGFSITFSTITTLGKESYLPKQDRLNSEKLPYILWITCKDISANLGCYGDNYARTPSLDSFAADGIKYTHAFGVTGVCAPNRSCLITGIYPTTLGSHDMRSTTRLPDHIKCFTEYLRQSGYYCTNNVKTDYNFPTPKTAWDECSRTARWRNRKPDQPFFAVFNYTSTHESRIRQSDGSFFKATSQLKPRQTLTKQHKEKIMHWKVLNKMSLIVVVAALAAISWAAPKQEAAPPPNAPAKVEWSAKDGKLSLRYHGTVILNAMIVAQDKDGKKIETDIKMEPKETPGDKVEQCLKFVLGKPQEGVELILRGTVLGSEEAFPAETRSEAQKRFPYVRNSVGLSRNLRNNAVYDRRWDWVLIGPPDGKTRILPTQVEKGRIAFSWESRGGSDLEVVFRPLFYQKHQELEHYKPWTYKVWKGSLTGYCTWWAYKTGFSQKTLDEIVDIFSAKNLPDFGYRYVQFDNCYQTGGGSPGGFLKWNGRFPGGPEYAVKKIRSGGMEAGIWVYCVFKNNDPIVQDMVEEHPEWFIHDAEGKLFVSHGWYSLDTTNKDALERMVRPLYRGLKKQGFKYVKIDGAGDLVDWGYRKCPEYFKKIDSSPGEALRKFYEAAREELGRDVYILSCWGVLPEVIGVVDGCRLATDGFRPAAFQGFNSWEGVVWRNDPDHCDILPVGREHSVMKTFAVKDAPMDTIIRPCVISMAGGVLLLSDKAEVYKDDRNLEGVKRSSPVLFTVPGQLYDFTPRGPRWFFRNHARQGGGESRWWFSEIDRPFDHWSVLARFNWRQKKLEWKRPGAPEKEVKFADLGLPEDREYLVFEFWTQKFLGRVKGSFTAPAQDTNNGLQVFAIREARAHPWVISTTRHISQGGVSLLDEKWDSRSKILSGRSAVVAGDPYVMTIHVPKGFRLKSAEVSGEKVETENLTHTAAVWITPSATKTVSWRITFAK